MDELFLKLRDILKNRQMDEMVWDLVKYSHKASDWNCFVFEQAEVTGGQQILDAGAGWGGLWRKNWKRMPEKIAVTCIDKHNTWADTFETDVRDMVKKGELPDGCFSFRWGDMEHMELGGKYDRIFFNHTASYMQDGDRMLVRFSDCLKEDGLFICTWGGSLVYEQLLQWLCEFGQGGAEMENVVSKRSGWIQDWENRLHRTFQMVEKRAYPIELTFEEPEDCFSFLLESNKGLQKVLSKCKKDFLVFLEKKADVKNVIRLKKDTLLYRCRKGEV